MGAVGLTVVGVATGSPAASASRRAPGPGFPTSQYPNDPDFAPCESQDPVTGCTDNEQWNLYGRLTGNTCLAPGGTVANRPHPDGGLPCWARNARDPEHASGVNMTGAWAQGNLGRPDVLIAYIEGGVNYSNDGVKDALDNIYLNKGELPYPEGRDGKSAGTYDFDGNGHFDIRDYAQDPRVNPPCPAGKQPFVSEEEGTTRGCVNGGQHQYLNKVDIGGAQTAYLSPEDLIAVFGHCKITSGQLGACPPGGRFDNDGNGYPNDVSGWNTQRNTNDPQTDDSAYSHAPGLIGDLAGRANNHYAGVGVCRRCEVLPIKQGAEAVGRDDQWAPALLYAVDAGADVVSSVVVSYTYSSFAREAVDYANSKGVLLSFDSNDFDSMDHTDGMLYDHVLPGNSLTQDALGPGHPHVPRPQQRHQLRHAQHLLRRGEQHLGGDAVPGRDAGDGAERGAECAGAGNHPPPAESGRGQTGADEHGQPGDPADAVAGRAGPVARQPGQRHRCGSHELVHPVRLRAPQHRRRDQADHVREGPADGRAELTALVRLRRPRAPKLPSDTR